MSGGYGAKMEHRMSGLGMAALNGDLSWIESREAPLSPFCSMLARMHWGAAWHAFSCALVDGELLGEFEPLLPDLFKGISSFQGGMFDSDVSFFWNELATETNFMTAGGEACEVALDRFLSILERRPDLAKLVKTCEAEGIPDILADDGVGNSPLGFAGDFIFALARSGPSAIERAHAQGLLPSSGYEAEWLRALSMSDELQSSAICEKVFTHSPSDGFPLDIVALDEVKGASKPRLEDWVCSLVKTNPQLARIVFDWVGNEVIKASAPHVWLDARMQDDDAEAAKQAAVIGILWERKALAKRSVEAGLARNRKLGGSRPALDAMMEAILIGGATQSTPRSEAKPMRL